MFLLYSILYSLVLVFYFPFEYMRRPGDIRRIWLRERLGRLSLPARGEGMGRTLWVHAVSVGETAAAATFIRAYKDACPDDNIVVSTITDTGRAVAIERLEGLADVVYLPFDLSGPLKRAVAAIQPDIFLVMETELWPNMIRVMKSSGIPVAVINGRVSEKSFRGYKSIRWIFSSG
jgi:3-deoxy-D-manno-octulosonic-acid transferase